MNELKLNNWFNNRLNFTFDEVKELIARFNKTGFKGVSLISFNAIDGDSAMDMIETIRDTTMKVFYHPRDFIKDEVPVPDTPFLVKVPRNRVEKLDMMKLHIKHQRSVHRGSMVLLTSSIKNSIRQLDFPGVTIFNSDFVFMQNSFGLFDLVRVGNAVADIELYKQRI